MSPALRSSDVDPYDLDLLDEQDAVELDARDDVLADGEEDR